MMIRTAIIQEHPAIVKLARCSPYTQDFSNRIFSGPASYEKGWITISMHGDELCGFCCVRHKVKEPVTSLYFLGIDPQHRRLGIGNSLLQDLKRRCPHPCIRLNVAKN